MPSSSLKRLTPLQLQMARDVVASLSEIEGFTADADHTAEAMVSLEQAVDAGRDAETRTKNAADAARDAAAALEQTFYLRVLRVREMVVGQFGSDSDEAASVGLKKKSERKKPTRSPKTAPVQ